MIKLLSRMAVPLSLVLIAGLSFPISASAETSPSDDWPPTQVATIFGTGITLGVDFDASGSLAGVSLFGGSQASQAVRIVLSETETVVDLRRSDGPDVEVAVAVVEPLATDDASDSDRFDLDRLDLSGLDLSGLDLSGLDLDRLDLNDLDLGGLDLDGLDLEGMDLNDLDLNDLDLDDLDELNNLGLDLSGLDFDDLIETYDEYGDRLNSELRSADGGGDGSLGTLPRD